MARKLRLEWAGACYHVINRGNYRRELFSGKGAAESFVTCLSEAAARFGWRLHAYVVMSNHFHLAVETPEPNLSDGMKWLQGTWARRFNEFRDEQGRPFQGRYKALHVEPGHALAQVAHYIHLNPIRAKIVSAERLLEYHWSSLPRFIGQDRPKGLVADTILHESGGLKDTRAGWRRYLDYLHLLAEEDAKRREEQYGRLSRGWAIGSEAFRNELKKELAAASMEKEVTFAIAGADREAHAEVRALLWEEALQALARHWKIRLDQLGPKASAPEKVRLATAMKLATSVSNGWLAERLGMGPAATVSQYVRRFRLKGLDRSKEFQSGLSKVKS
jgi:REP element-mobilizing transposase RayT